VDKFWRVLRVACIGVFAIVGLGIASCTAINWVTEYPKYRVREALKARGFEVLQRKHSNAATTLVSNLFGADLDGVCVVRGGLNSSRDVTAFQAASPVKFRSAISEIAEMNDPRTTDGDHWYEYIYVVKGGTVFQKYELVRGAVLDIGAADDACYDADAKTEVQFDPSDQTMVIGFPSKI
jgi:hypothetical protein